MKTYGNGIVRLMTFFKLLTAYAGVVSLLCCDTFLEAEVSESQIVGSDVFSSDATANSAVAGIYYEMVQPSSFSSGSSQSISSLCGLSADELTFYPETLEYLEIEANSINPSNSNVLALWMSLYKIIYNANAVIEGLEKSSALTADTKNQLMGEALFIRSFSNFYLINLFGNVPLILTTNYQQNSHLSRSPSSEVYDKIVEDLKKSIDLLNENYLTLDQDFFTPSRSRPNKYAAIAFLARVYLYIGDWSNAELHASTVIENNALYRLVDDVNMVFLKNSDEAIWQLRPVIPNINTFDGNNFIINSMPQYSVLTPELISSFDDTDLRKIGWINSYSFGDDVFFYPYKYKVKDGVDVVEYSMVLRLAEQYLIRAEARLQKSDLSGSVADINEIRKRAGLALYDENIFLTKEDGLMAIEAERKLEFFTEWGHRWFDLRRYGFSTSRLSSLKPQWNIEDVLYPIPQAERNRNPNLGIQNPGY